jgi:4-hydroxybenzoate polyprenyltransferase
MDAQQTNTPIEKRSIIYKFFSLLSVVRGYNILLIVIAQYLASIFIFSPNKSLKEVLLNHDLFFIVLASACIIASGYIINNFYDAEKDKINRPVKSKIDSVVHQKTKLKIYFFLNFLGSIFGLLVSWKAALFFAIYIFLIWFYSHKLKKYPITGLLAASILSILPFFVIFVYYRNFSKIIFVHALFVFLILLIKELIKALENFEGDILLNYKTTPISYGIPFTKKAISLIILLTFVPMYFLYEYPEIGLMKYYFYGTSIVLTIFMGILWFLNSNGKYLLLHNIIKLVLFLGVFSLALIDTSVIIKRLI